MAVIPRFRSKAQHTATSLSKLAKDQLCQGWKLTGTYNMGDPTILDTIFDDKNLFTTPLYKFYERAKKFVTPQSELSTNKIRGISVVFAETLFSRQILGKCGTKLKLRVDNNTESYTAETCTRANRQMHGRNLDISQNDLPSKSVQVKNSREKNTKDSKKTNRSTIGTLFYFPPWHPISQARYSRPAIVLIRGSGLPYNGITPNLVPKNGKSMNPFDYAAFRRIAARRFRKALQSVFGNSRDGVYVIMMSRVPTFSEARAAMINALKRVNNADLSWASKQSNILTHTTMNTLLKRANQSPVPWNTDPKNWS
ncbi:hypothetical protein DASB73_041690 [Starmerella bacillaris]|uniref:Uncharacterized protein n=1 Tax=Starmerella bacillaris TaxID=1247836 RepID=A0AAV5RNW7_STABA|nr:hypothetical protein DASB73_041690 [Starmerella bacillaris]